MKNKFKSIRKNEIDKVINQFDKQIKKEYTIAKGDKEKCPSYWHKILFLKTVDLNINDWRNIRSGNYWEIRDSLDGIDELKFRYKRVIDYLG